MKHVRKKIGLEWLSKAIVLSKVSLDTRLRVTILGREQHAVLSFAMDQVLIDHKIIHE
jgi:hypothetical protein